MILRANVSEALVSLYSAKQRSILALIGIVGKTPCTDQAIALEQDALSEPATYRPRALSAAA